jgi:microcystin-dependent protein
MSEPFVGQILAFAGNYAPANYALCAGQSIPISQNPVLYQLIGTIFGGDGVNNFNLPDLRSRVPVHEGQGLGLSPYMIGQMGGTENVTLITNQIPAHNHTVNVVAGSGSGSLNKPAANAFLSDETTNANPPPNAYLGYAAANQINLAPQTIAPTGNSLPHNNIQPVQAITYCIALYGIYPTRS